MQGIYDIAEILAQNELYDVVLSPGSRCAPLTNAVVQHDKLSTFSIIDERSAGFYALGMSLKTEKSSTLIWCVALSMVVACLTIPPRLRRATRTFLGTANF